MRNSETENGLDGLVKEEATEGMARVVECTPIWVDRLQSRAMDTQLCVSRIVKNSPR